MRPLKGQGPSRPLFRKHFIVAPRTRAHTGDSLSEQLPHGLAELLNLALRRHIHVLLPNSDNHTTHD